MRVFSGVCLALLALSLTGCSRPQTVTSEQAACALATAKITVLRGLPATHVARCEPMSGDAEHYALVLYAHCREELCGSTSMGWFAVRKATGEVFEWDVSNEKAGAPVGLGS